MFNQLTLLCRPGFEKECAGEIMEQANKRQFPAYVQTSEQSGYVFLISTRGRSADSDGTDQLISANKFSIVNLCSTVVRRKKGVYHLPESNRIPDILDE